MSRVDKKWPRCKIELHVHLDGAMRPQTIIDLAKKKGISLPAYNVKALLPYISVSLDKPSSLSGFLKCFSVFIPVVKGDKDAIERIAYEFCEDQTNRGVLYFEARYCPMILASKDIDEDTEDVEDGITPRDVVMAVNRGIARGCAEFRIKARTILCCMRHKPEWSERIVELCAEFREQGVVGIDLAGDESMGEFPAFNEHVKAFEHARSLGIHRTVHAGEGGPAASVKEALDTLHAERIGHGYHVLEDSHLYDRVIRSGVHLEVCPKSSYLTGAVTPVRFHKHPIIKFARDGVNFSINSDDPCVCQSSVEKEFSFVFNDMGFSESLLGRASFNAARSCFLPPLDRAQLIEDLKHAFGVV